MQEDILQAAQMLYENIKADIENASTRIEHIRITTLAQEAHQLLTDLENYLLPDSPHTVLDSTDEEI